ncbi:hypothetical protein EB796_019079 [Bugula neritina]|uniref:Peptidase A2 domain-containing protein n=1 Tax=Bugula neritina TaxID=10212 RepID=A0A7J7J9A2_BUGNE|nr:hypothetical protein EB796_019079 [Bugula neritina]
MKLRRLAEGCEFGNQRDSMIRDKLLFGIDDSNEREKLMKEVDEKLIQNVDNRKSRIPSEVAYDKHSKNRCEQCGKSHYKSQRCPAYGTKCAKCNQFNHWARVCRHLSRVNEVQPEKGGTDVYLGETHHINSIDSQSWYTNLRVSTNKHKGQRIKFKLDTGASLSVCGPHHVSGELIPTNKRLYGPGQTLLTCLGTIKCQITSKNERINEDLYVIQDQTTPLLSRSACEKLNLISVDSSQCQIENVCVDEKLFQGLGKVNTEHVITLKGDAKPFAIHVPRPIPFPRRNCKYFNTAQ